MPTKTKTEVKSLSADEHFANWQKKLRDQGNKLGPLAKASLQRPDNFASLSFEEQWGIDKRLGILDWDGSTNS